MPRSTAKSKSGNNNNKCTIIQAKKATVTKTLKNDIKNEKVFKKEMVVTATDSIAEGAFHRKSERRRVARDIFLVFEEQPNSRRARRANKKQSKPKFAHLKVDDPIKSKGLLRDIKNVPRCYLSSSDINATVPAVVPVLKTNSSTQKIYGENKVKGKSAACDKLFNLNKPGSLKSIKLSAVDTQPCSITDDSRLVARVNPIFLWVKQDDTRIVEVRCEDYDKRNRIRITKTSNGWRAIPRSDPSSSKVLSFYPTPLMKVKRESCIPAENNKKNLNNNSHIESKGKQTFKDFLSETTLQDKVVKNIGLKLNGIDTVYNPLVTEKCKSRNRNEKVKKSNERISKKRKYTVSATERLLMKSESLTKVMDQTFNTNISDQSSKIKVKNDSVEYKMCIRNSDESLSPNYIKAVDIHDFDNNRVNTLNIKLNTLSSLTIDVPSEIESTYQKNIEENISFQLCPKTGLFLPNSRISEAEYETSKTKILNAPKPVGLSPIIVDKEQFVVEGEKVNVEAVVQHIDENHESLEAETRNLKDLLDDADLLQNCDDNANSDADLIDTLVKTSCENNLIQSNEVILKGNVDQIHKSLQSPNEMVVQFMAEVNDPPKCLSFNEAGEIEGLNGELFQSNTYVETFEKQSSNIFVDPQITLHSTTSGVVTSQRQSVCENIVPVIEMVDMSNSKTGAVNIADESPKDLSYKKREEICSPSESRSQCAVTSSSDVIKSPQHEDKTTLASSSETLKNLILEQFMKLNALTNQHQRDSIDLGIQKDLDISHLKSVYTSKSGESTDFIDTVVIEDDFDENDDRPDGPHKKRLRLNTRTLGSHNANNVKSKISMIDKDPDPLTQLRLLIRNRQWKVPDPILVPKDRLSAVLASPAREIPLLITTRPELRLPEAFAYPEIIQNPNILVISMAQLEAILKNEIGMTKITNCKTLEENVTHNSQDHIDTDMTKEINKSQLQSSRQVLLNTSTQPSNILNYTNTVPVSNNVITDIGVSSNSLLKAKKQESAKCSQRDSSLSTDINTATMAVLNQMLWLPYFGQISQDIIKYLKNPLVLEKYSNLVPLFNAHLNNLSNLDETYKNSNLIGQTVPTLPSNSKLQCVQQHHEINEELLLYQKVVKHQMQNAVHLNQRKADSTQYISSVPADNVTSMQYISMDATNANIASLSNFIEKKQNFISPNNKQQTNKSFINKDSTNNSSTENSYDLRNSAAGRNFSELKHYANSPREVSENKPRLTCKSLSNLLEPEHCIIPSSNSSISYVPNLSSDLLKGMNGVNRNITECKPTGQVTEGKGIVAGDLTIIPPPARSGNVINDNIDYSREINKQKATSFADTITPETTTDNTEVSALTADTNVPLWHPLFGSNTKSTYNSPWHWTTVTATGE